MHLREVQALLVGSLTEDQALLVRRDAFLVLNLLLHVLDRVRRLHIKCDGLAGEGLRY